MRDSCGWGAGAPNVRVQIYGVCFNESRTDNAECLRKVTSGRKVAGAIRSLLNAKDLQFECARVLHELLIVPVLLYVSETRL